MVYSVGLQRDALAYLEWIYGGPVPMAPEALFKLLRKKPWSVTNRTLLVQLIASAAALVIIQSESELFRELVVRHCKKKRSADLPRLVIEVLLHKRDFQAATDRKLSTWASAVRYLVGKKVRPSSIQAFSKTPGEGVDTWARRNARPRKMPTAKFTPAQVTISVGKDMVKWKIDDSRKLEKFRAELTRIQNAQSSD